MSTNIDKLVEALEVESEYIAELRDLMTDLLKVHQDILTELQRQPDVDR